MTLRQTLIFLISLSAIAFASTSNALLPKSEVDVRDFPSSVAFIIVSNLSKCTATKIAAKTFLTAAHCFENYKSGSDISIEQLSRGEMVLEVRTQISKLITHESYVQHPGRIGSLFKTAIGKYPDLAIFKTVDDINIPNAKINFKQLKLGQEILVGGYGAQGKNICYPVLHSCSLNIADQKVKLIKSMFFYSQPDAQLPHFLTEGDSGGAAYIRNATTGELEVVGVNSMMTPASAQQFFDIIFTANKRANPPRAASIYVRISEFEAWLRKASNSSASPL